MRIAGWLMLTALAAAPAFGQTLAAATQAATQPAATLPAAKGQLLTFTFDQSKIFPGTQRKISVYIPAEYDGKSPACLIVDQDSLQFHLPQVMDQLIAKRARWRETR